MSRTSGRMPWETLAGSATRSPRVLDTRERETTIMSDYLPPSMLPDPTPQDGYAFRWVRSSIRNFEDKVHFNKRSREGYAPVLAQDHPELMAEIGLTQESGIVTSGGLILCKIDQHKVDARNRYYRQRNANEMEAADSSYMRDNDPRLAKVVERKTSFGRTI